MRAALARNGAATLSSKSSLQVSPKSCSQRSKSRGSHALESQMFRYRIALISTRYQHHRRPKVVHSCKMEIPIAEDGALENRCKLWVRTDFGVKFVHEATNSIFRDLLCAHGRDRLAARDRRSLELSPKTDKRN